MHRQVSLAVDTQNDSEFFEAVETLSNVLTGLGLDGRRATIGVEPCLGCLNDEHPSKEDEEGEEDESPETPA